MYTTLISATELASHIADTNWVVLDCRHDLMDTNAGQAAYDQGHIPGAQFVHLDQRLSAPKTGADGVFRGRHPLPEKASFIATLQALGINNDSQVIVYDAHRHVCCEAVVDVALGRPQSCSGARWWLASLAGSRAGGQHRSPCCTQWRLC